MSNKHTPAPWSAETELGSTAHCGIAICTTTKEYNIANVYLDMMDTSWGKVNPIHRPENEQSKANAHLIAAAPELLEALERWIGGCDTSPHYPSAETIWLAQAAIAKAKGVTS